MSQNWVNNVLVPCILWRIKKANVLAVSSERLCLIKKKYDWASSQCIKYRDYYALGWLEDIVMAPFGGAYRYFALVDSLNAFTEQNVGFYESRHPNDAWDAFSLSFNQNSTSCSICALSKLKIPSDAQEELKNNIERRNNNDAFRLGSYVILKPKETFEEVLIERELMDDVCLNVASDSIKYDKQIYYFY
jgi:hypothetical protein